MVREGLWRTAYEDPLDAAAAALLELVLERGMDPWALDLARLASLYVEKVRERGVDFRVAGRVVRLFWEILAVKSEELLRGAEEEQVQELEEIEVPEVGTRILVPVRRPPLRPVTLGELLEAIEELRRGPRRRRRPPPAPQELPVHEESWEGAVGELLEKLPEGEVPLSSLHDGTPQGFINVFFPALVLFLRGEVELRQEEPYGEIMIRRSRAG